MTQSRIAIGPLLHEESIFGANGNDLQEDAQIERIYFLGYEVDPQKQCWIRSILICIDSVSGKKCWETTLGTTEILGMIVDETEHMVYVLDSLDPEEYEKTILLDRNHSRYLIVVDGITGIIKQRIEIPGFAGRPRIDYHARILWMRGRGHKYWQYLIPEKKLIGVSWVDWSIISSIEYLPVVGKTFLVTDDEILEEVNGAYVERIHQGANQVYPGRSRNGIYFHNNGIWKFDAEKMQVEALPVPLGPKDWEVSEESGDIVTLSEEDGKKYLTVWRMQEDPMHIVLAWKKEVPMMSEAFSLYNAKIRLLFIKEDGDKRANVYDFHIAIYDIASPTAEEAFVGRIQAQRHPQVFMTAKGKLVIKDTDYEGGTLSMYDVHQAQS